MQTSDLYPVTLPGGATIRRAPIGFYAAGGPDWRLAFYHGVWHATKGSAHLTTGTLAEAVKAARGAKA